MSIDPALFNDPRVQALPAFSQTLEELYPQRDFTTMSAAERIEYQNLICEIAYLKWRSANLTHDELEKEALEMIAAQEQAASQRLIQEHHPLNQFYNECMIQPRPLPGSPIEFIGNI